VTRLKFLSSLFGLAAASSLQADQNHIHEFVKGPFYVTAALSFEEPEFYPPEGLTPIEFCKTCGVLRLPPKLALSCAGQSNVQSCEEVKP